jgi:LysR family transcriptional regulator, transcription activator of glutamate synthase operon
MLRAAINPRALSHQIQRLERELGTPLFERTSRRVLPTEAGQVIASRARRILTELNGARQEVDELRGVLRGHVWVGGLLPAGDIDVPGLLALFSRALGNLSTSPRRAGIRSCCGRSPPAVSPARSCPDHSPPGTVRPSRCAIQDRAGDVVVGHSARA